VFGHEHYAEDFEDLACAATPVHGPISGKMVGAVDLTRWRKDADALLIALAKTTADQITQALPAAGSAPEVEPVQEYLRACRHSSGIVLARNSDMVMMNDYARQVLDPGDQVVLLGQAAGALAARRSGAVAVELPTGAKARIYCRPVRGDGRFGGVVHVKLIESGSRPTAGAPAPSRMFLAGLVGSGPLWLRGCQQVDAAYAAGELLALEGEPGVGKLAVLRAVHQRRNPAGRFRVLDAAEAGGQDWQVGERPELLNGEGSLVIRHVDQLSTRRLHALPAALQEARAARRQQSPWVGARPALEGTGQVAAVLPEHRRASPLRHHVEDLRVLVPFFLAKLNQHPRLVCSPEAMQPLLRSSWPGNTGQLRGGTQTGRSSRTTCRRSAGR
jgi:transcriptional regulator of acetoin/glycerol metabolism